MLNKFAAIFIKIVFPDSKCPEVLRKLTMAGLRMAAILSNELGLPALGNYWGPRGRRQRSLSLRLQLMTPVVHGRASARARTDGSRRW